MLAAKSINNIREKLVLAAITTFKIKKMEVKKIKNPAELFEAATEASTRGVLQESCS